MKKYIAYLFIIFIAYVPFIKPYGALDSVYPELLFLSISQLIIASYFTFRKQKEVYLLGSSTIFLFLFLIWSLITAFTSFNPTEGFVDWFKFFTFFSGIFYVTQIFKDIKNKNFFYGLLIISLSVESIYIFREFLNIYSFESPPSRAYQFIGFTSNLNVTAFSILIKIPILLYFFFNQKNKILQISSSIIFVISLFDLLIISSRGAIISFIFLGLLLVVFKIFFKRKTKTILSNKKMLRFIFLSIFTLSAHIFLYQNSQDIRIDQRLQSFDLQDSRSSYNFRKGFYQEAIKGFIDKPLLGHGIGNWKIFSIHYGKNRIREYQVPYHVHNDFLQMFAETGFIGGILYILIIIVPVFYLSKSIFFDKKTSPEKIFLAASLVVFIFDSSFNFPRARAVSMSNFVLIYSYYLAFFRDEKNFTLSSIKFRLLNICLFLFTIGSIVVFQKLYVNSKQQIKLVQDFNFTRYFERDLDQIEEISHKFPTLTHTGMPLAAAKANYYSYQGKTNEAITLFKKGMKKNPFLGQADIGIANIFLQKGRLDSAYFHSRRALDKLPYNQLHIATHQMVLSKFDDSKYLKEGDSIFEIIKNEHIAKIWENHILLQIKYKSTDSFDMKDRSLVKEALVKFPGNKKILAAEKLINNSKEKLILANVYDQEAFINFQEEDYEKSIDNWEKAKSLIPNEDSYYLNIAQAYNGLGGYDLSLQELKKIEDLDIVEQNGKLEFLRAVAYLGLEQKDNYCKNLKISFEKGYKLSGETLKKLNCY